jgi:iron complex outermembrane receptor protein
MLRVAVALALAPTVAWADDEVRAPDEARADDGMQMRAPDETIVITSLRLPREVRDEPTAVTVIDRREIARSPMVLADDLLRTSPSVGTFRRSSSAIADPTSQGLSLRGVGPSAVSRALVLRDGIPANDPFGGWMYWRSISPLALERIEIAPSGASALFGNFALGGAVDLVSRPITGGAFEAVVAGGTLGTGWSAARLTEKVGAFGIAIDGEAFHSEGYTPIARDQRGPIDGDASSTHGAGSARVEYTRGRSQLYATGRYFQQALDAGTQFTTADVRAIGYGAGWRHTSGAGTVHVAMFGGDQLFVQERARVAMGRTSASLASHQETPSNDQGALATWSGTAGGHTLLAGADARRVAGRATDSLSPAMIDDTTLVERSAGGEQRFAGAFVQDALRIGSRVEVSAALRLDAWQNTAASTTRELGDGTRETMAHADRTEMQLDPKVGVLVHASDAVALRASAYRAFRAPTLNELYRPFQVGTVLTAANAELRPEILHGIEAGPQIVVDGIVVRATAFYNRHADAIANVTLAEPLPSGATRQRQNLGTARIAGLEIDASWRPSPAWTLAIAHTFVDAKVIEAPGQPDLVGKGLPQDPKLRATGSLTYDEPRHVTVTAQVRYLGRMFEDDLQTLPIGAVVLVDARVGRMLGKGIGAFVAGQNLFDRRYLVGRAGVDTEGAPRTIVIGLTYAR